MVTVDGRFNVVILAKGAKYGLTGSLVADKTMVEFYDGKYAGRPFGPLGQFVARYYVSTLLKDEASLAARGLALDCGVPAWSVTANGMKAVFAMIKEEV